MGIEVDPDEQCFRRTGPIRASWARWRSQQARDRRKPDITLLLRVAYDKIREAADRGETVVHDVFAERPVRDEAVKSALVDALEGDGYTVHVRSYSSISRLLFIFSVEW